MNDWEFNVNSGRNDGIEDRKRWILRLLYAPVKGSAGKDIPGRTRLMKGTFLTKKKLEEEEDTHSEFEFRPDKFGPLDPKVFTATEELDEEGLINIEEGGMRGDVYSLTREGERAARDEFKQISESEQQLLSWLRKRHLSPNSKSLSQLLTFVYNQYPETTKKSELEDLSKR